MSRHYKATAAKATRVRARAIFEQLSALYPSIVSPLHYRNHFELLVAVVLSAQAQDKVVNEVTPELFRRWPDPAAMAQADPAEVEGVLARLGLYRSKSRNCIRLSAQLIDTYNCTVPDTFPELVSLAGVGRKTAQVVLFQAFGKPGLAVDTHVHRLSNRLGLVAATTPAKTEPQLKALFEPQHWGALSLRLIHHGRAICTARKPKCAECPVLGLCELRLR